MRNERLALSERSESNGPDPLDALIDHSARQIVAGEPSSSLRRAVRNRVERRRSPWVAAPAIAGAAAVIVIAAVLVGRTLFGPAGTPGERDNVRPTLELAGTPGAPDTAHPTIDAEAAPVGEPVGSRGVRLQADQQRLTRRLADDVTVMPQEEEPLIPPIAIEPLVTVQIAVRDSTTVESSGVMPIEIEPLQIELLRSIE